MKRRPYRGKETESAPHITMHQSVPTVAFELALYRMQHTTETTHTILSDYLREIGA